MLLTFYAFMTSGVKLAGEMREPRRDIPRAIITMVAGVTALYMAVIWPISQSRLRSRTRKMRSPPPRSTRWGRSDRRHRRRRSIQHRSEQFQQRHHPAAHTLRKGHMGMLPRWFMGVSKRYGTANAILFTGGASIVLDVEVFAVLAWQAR